MSTSLGDTMPQDRSGQVVREKYRLIRRVGEGGMGTVYEAEHLVVGRRFALKFLHAELTRSEDALARFRREAKAAGSLDSEHIAAVTDFDVTSDGSPFIVMEYLAGESLAELLARDGPLSVPRVIGALRQVCDGLEAAHAAGIIHRDLKPENLFVVRRKDGRDLMKILDFGIAKLERPEAGGSVTRSGATLGTPFYMAPEQARGEKSFDQRVDIYALGVILYELLSGQKPHPGDSYNSILAHILGQPAAPLPTLRPGLPEGLADVVHGCLATDPNDRPSSAAELSRMLAPFAGGGVARVRSQVELRVLSDGARTIGADERSRRFHPALSALGLLALAAAGVAAWVFATAPPRPGAAVLQTESPKSRPVASEGSARPARSAAPTMERVVAAASGHAAGRPPGRPRPVSTAKAPSQKRPESSRPEAQKAATSPEENRAGTRVKFDTQNPYE